MSAYRKFSDALHPQPHTPALGALAGLGGTQAASQKPPQQPETPPKEPNLKNQEFTSAPPKAPNPPKVSALADPQAWRDQYEERAAIRQYEGHYSREEAEALAWGELQNRWHVDHGERVADGICAGCRRPIVGADALNLIDGNRVHDGPDHDCLIRHGERWRAAATRALADMGLVPPT